MYPTINVLVQVFQSRTRYTKVRQIKHASLQQLKFLLLLVVSVNIYYKFSYHVDREHDIILRWPSWPLPSKRVKKCRDTLRKKTDITPQELLSAEKEALSSWLDVKYEVSDFSSIIGYLRMHPFERALKKSVCPSQFYDWIDVHKGEKRDFIYFKKILKYERSTRKVRGEYALLKSRFFPLGDSLIALTKSHGNLSSFSFMNSSSEPLYFFATITNM